MSSLVKELNSGKNNFDGNHKFPNISFLNVLFFTEGGSETESLLDSDFGRCDLMATTSSDFYFTYKPRYLSDTWTTWKKCVLFYAFHQRFWKFLCQRCSRWHLSVVALISFCSCVRPARATEDDGFEKNLEQQLEDELKLEDLVKHRQETDKTCLVSSSFSKRGFGLAWIVWDALTCCMFSGRPGHDGAVTLEV